VSDTVGLQFISEIIAAGFTGRTDAVPIAHQMRSKYSQNIKPTTKNQSLDVIL